jgi:putative transposase
VEKKPSRSDDVFSKISPAFPHDLIVHTKMANTYSSLHFHIVFSTKNRQRWLKSEIEERVWRVLAGIAKDHRMTPIEIGGVDDHVHVLVSLPPALSLSKAVQYLKGVSSKWIHEELAGFRSFAWQDGYGAFTVSRSQLPAVSEYVRGQRQHHAKVDFRDEFRALLRKHNVEFDERYLWG